MAVQLVDVFKDELPRVHSPKDFFIDAHISPYLSHLSSLFSRTSHLSLGLFHLSPFLLASLMSPILSLSYVSFLSLYMWIFEYRYLHVYMKSYVYACMYEWSVCVYMYVYMYMLMCMFMDMSLCMYMYM